jgi:hypothetical protein
MVIQFDVAGEPVEFRRNWFTGRSELRMRGETVVLRSSLNPSTHFSMRLTRVLQHRLSNHEIAIEQTRPLLFAGFRPHDYRIAVDGVVVRQQRGY